MHEKLKHFLSTFPEIVDLFDNGIAVFGFSDQKNDFQLLAYNQESKNICTYGEKLLEGNLITDIFSDAVTNGLSDAFFRVVETGQPETIANHSVDTNTHSSIEFKIFRLDAKHVLTTLRDIRDRVEITRALQDSEAHLKEAQKLAHIGNWNLDLLTGKAYWSDEEYRLLGYEPNSVEPCIDNFIKAIHPDDLALVQDEMQKSMDPNNIGEYQIVHRVITAQGDRVVDERGKVDFDDSGKPIRMFGTTADISQLVESENKIKLYAEVFKQNPDAIIITDKQNCIIAANSAFETLTGYDVKEVIGQNPSMLSSDKTSKDVYEEMWHSLKEYGKWQGQVIDKRKDGSHFPKRLSINAIKDSRGDIINYVANFADITEQLEARQQIEYLAHYDTVTGLPNRYSLDERLAQALKHAHRSKSKLAVIFIDLDHFKHINDSMGHLAGDNVLKEISNRLKVATRRDADVIARLGGDEFVIILTELENSTVAALIATTIISSVSQPFIIDGLELHTSASLGISVFPDDADNKQDLMKNADLAMYHSKELGRNQFQFFNESLDKNIKEIIGLDTALRSAIKQRELEVYYQPKVSSDTEEIVGFEALLRWIHPTKGFIPPDKFIPIAESTGQINEIGAWVLEQVCLQLSEWSIHNHNIHIAINVSVQQLQSATFINEVTEIFQRHDISLGQIQVEITESVAMENPENTIRQLHSLHDLGIKIAIDDFGTGYSSLAYLKRLPLHFLKLDREFVRDIETDPNDRSICDATISLSHSLGMKVIAEGVETEMQKQYLSGKGCDYFQGYYFGKPMPATEAGQLIKQ